jgi:hypothetical protein
MATKIPEICPKCNTECMPNDKPVMYTERWGSFPVRIWNYDCSNCGWTWANELQRKHNEQEYYKRRKESKFQSGGWITRMNG